MTYKKKSRDCISWIKRKDWRLFLYACYCNGSLSLLICVNVSSVLFKYRVYVFCFCPQFFVIFIKDIELPVTVNMYHTKLGEHRFSHL